MSHMSIYAAGGCAINIAASMSKYAGKKEFGFADISTYFIDTSSSNIHPDIPEKDIYLLEDLDGSGKVRKSNYAAITESCSDILHQFKPSDINVVLHSASGGSGSVISPVLVSELLSRGLTVIVLAVGSSNSKIECQNTLNTLKSYESIALKTKRPVCMFYRENSVTTPRGTVDLNISTALVMLATLFSSDNKELDLSDLTNFIKFNDVTSHEPQLALLELFESKVDLSKGQTLISAATLVDETSESSLGVPVEYQCVGYIPSKVTEAIKLDLPLHAVTITGHFHKIADALTNKLNEYDEARKVVVSKSIVSDTDVATDEGIIL